MKMVIWMPKMEQGKVILAPRLEPRNLQDFQGLAETLGRANTIAALATLRSLRLSDHAMHSDLFFEGFWFVSVVTY